jgi:hypothetical protein
MKKRNSCQHATLQAAAQHAFLSWTRPDALWRRHRLLSVNFWFVMDDIYMGGGRASCRKPSSFLGDAMMGKQLAGGGMMDTQYYWMQVAHVFRSRTTRILEVWRGRG